jgi:DNA polymerase V
VTSKRELQQALATYTASCAKKLRSEKACTRKVHVFLQTNVHRKEDAQYLHSITLAIPVATNATNELMKFTMTALNILYKPGYNYHKTGVIVMSLVPEKEIQLGLFDTENRSRNTKAMKAVDAVNKAYGTDTIRSAVQEFSKDWKLRSNFRSGRYTSRWNELPVINAK